MTNEYEQYGSLSILDKLKLLSEWAPLLSQAQAIALASTPHEQAVAIIKFFQFAAGKTETTIDDEALSHLQRVLETPEAREAFAWVVSKIEKALEAQQ